MPTICQLAGRLASACRHDRAVVTRVHSPGETLAFAAMHQAEHGRARDEAAGGRRRRLRGSRPATRRATERAPDNMPSDGSSASTGRPSSTSSSDGSLTARSVDADADCSSHMAKRIDRYARQTQLPVDYSSRSYTR